MDDNDFSGIQMTILERLRKNPSCIRQLAKEFGKEYNYICFETSKLKKIGFILVEKDKGDRRIKLLSLTNDCKIFLARLEAKKSAIAKLDSWLDKKFSEIGIDCERLFG